jgi:hypothetical protein
MAFGFRESVSDSLSYYLIFEKMTHFYLEHVVLDYVLFGIK